MDPRTRPRARIYPSLVRPILVGGIERNAAGLLAIGVLVLVFGFRLNWLSPSLAAVGLLVVLPALRRATRRDGEFLAVYRRHLLRAGIYEGHPPHDRPRARDLRTF
ncbi:MAG TPA: VirB3 family type IV secretion system protein [Thermoanaerobaculia bacterium]|nr:VirB3 family type IV secretion system protein [Thermoanaerobaculia bacterium]